jgi:hypothetical protein
MLYASGFRFLPTRISILRIDLYSGFAMKKKAAAQCKLIPSRSTNIHTGKTLHVYDYLSLMRALAHTLLPMNAM